MDSVASSGPAESSDGAAAASNARGRGRGGHDTRGRGRGRNRGAPDARGGRTQRGRARGRGGHDGQASTTGTGGPEAAGPAQGQNVRSLLTQSSPKQSADGGDNEDPEAEVCFICASPVVHQSVAPCNHRTCHICALRMRALYKTKECAHCRTVAPFVIFTDDAARRFEDYKDADITTTDDNIGIRYNNEDIVGDTVLLLRYNCPDDSCDFAGLGWPDLHRHVRTAHHKKMCDLCTRNKKVFTHEHELFSDKELERHMRHGDDQPGAVDQTGFKGHPLCSFCGERFYDDDKLYEHCRNKHERCFLCDRQDPRQPHYYRNYDALEHHFKDDHFPCLDRECLEKKFVVFASELDLKAHQLAEHGTTLSKDLRRDARVVDMSGFDFRQSYQQERRGGSGRERGRDGQGRGRGRDPNAEPLPVSSAQPLRRDELAFQRQMAIHSSQSISNRTFGGQLSSAPATTSTSPNPSPRPSAPASSSAGPSQPAALSGEMESLNLTDPNLSAEDRARLQRHSSVIERASNLLQNDKTKIAAFRSHISSYRTGKMTASALVDAFFTLFSETSSTAMGTLVREVADLFDDKGKADALRKAWNDWRAINEDYPTLPGLGGMHGATSSNSGWAAAAASSPVNAVAAPSQRHTTRVLKLKSSTQQSRRSSLEPSTSWSAPSSTPRANPTTSAFPSLPSSSGSSTPRPAAGAAGWGTSTVSRPEPRGGKPPANREDAFPALPAAPKPLTTIFGYGRGSVRRDLGGSSNTGFNWGGSTAAEGARNEADADEGAGEGSKGKKKGNKGKKQVLVQWG